MVEEQSDASPYPRLGAAHLSRRTVDLNRDLPYMSWVILDKSHNSFSSSSK